jgi:hypothetical protein
MLLVALCVTCLSLLSKTIHADKYDAVLLEEVVPDGLVLSCTDYRLGFEDITRASQNIVSPFSKTQGGLDFELVEKAHSIFTKVSFRYLYTLRFFQGRDEYLFLDLRKLLI